MNHHLEPVDASTTSPFDDIKITSAEGRDYWSARDLMVLMGYDRWENLSSAIDRAQTAALNQGHAVTDLFRGTTKNSGDRPRTEFDTVRELMPGCYVPAESAARVIGRATGKAFSPASREYIGRHHRVGR